MAINIKNMETLEEVQCIGLWTNPVYNPRIIYGLFGQSHTAQSDTMIEAFGEPLYIWDEIWQRYKTIKPWRIVK